MSDAQDIIDAAAQGRAGRVNIEGRWAPPDANLILESEHLATTIDLEQRPLNRRVRVIVATRYCVLPIEDDQPLTAEREAELRGWLTRRERLFRAYTLPSLWAQQHTPNMWALLVDQRLIHIVGPAIQADLPPWAYIVPVPPGRSAGWMLDRVAEAEPDPRWTVVARVDNDDAIAVDYCKALAIWTGLASPGECLLSFPIGAQTIDGYGRDRLANSTTGHFSARVIAPGGRLNVALSYMHTEVYRGAGNGRLGVPVRQLITTQPMWVEVLHGENLANHSRPGPMLEVSPEVWAARYQGRS